MLCAQSDSASALLRIKHHVMALADDSMGGRPPGTEYEKNAANYIIDQLADAGIVYGTYTFKAPINNDTLTCTNVIGYIDNKADSTIIIGAHYDHLGMGGSKSRDHFKKGIHCGADDNASGVALMLELARSIATNGEENKKYNYVFAAFSAHESGLYGSANFIATEQFKQLKTKLYINLDMVGRLNIREQKIKVSYSKGLSLNEILGTGKQQSITITIDEDNSLKNDYSIFCEVGVPAISITTGLHADYHRISDTADKINYAGIVQILEILKRLSLL